MPRPVCTLRFVLCAFSVAAPLLAPSAASADVIDLSPSKDNTLYQDPTGSLSNGAGPGFFVGATASLNIRRAVVAFDIAASIPAGATITAATLTLHMSSTQTTPVP